MPEDIIAESGTALLHFRSDSDLTARGFDIYYRVDSFDTASPTTLLPSRSDNNNISV